MLLSRDAIAAATEVGLSGDDFYKPAHGHIFDAINALYARGDSVDPVTVADALRRRELLDAIGGPAILVTLQAGTPATTTAGKYARIVEEHALLRRLIGVAGEIAENAYGAARRRPGHDRPRRGARVRGGPAAGSPTRRPRSATSSTTT